MAAPAAADGAAISRSMAERNAARVLPEPVGAMTSTSLPERIAGHASRCASVGVPKACRNHSRVGAENGSKHSHICSIMVFGADRDTHGPL